MYDCTSNNWSHWDSNEKLKEKFGSCARKTSDRFTTKDNYTWNITHNTESTAAGSLKPERWGSPLVQEMYREEKACDKRYKYNNNNNNNNNNVLESQHTYGKNSTFNRPDTTFMNKKTKNIFLMDIAVPNTYI